MTRQRIMFWGLLIVALVAAFGYRRTVFREPPPAPPVKVAFVTGGSGPYWQLTVNGAKAAADDYDVDLHVQMPTENENLEQQMAILAALDLNNLDGVALSPLDAEGQTSLIDQLVRRNKKVVTFDSDAPLSDRQSFIGTNNYAAGRTCARVVNEALPDGGKIVVLLANLSKDNMVDRKGGFHERIMQFADDVEEGEPLKFQIVGYLVDNGDSDECEKLIRDTLDKHPDLSCIVGMNARHGPVLLRVLEDLDKLGQIKLVTFDYPDETLAGIEAGTVHATIAQDPYMYGYDAVDTLVKLCHGEESSLPIVGKGSSFVAAEPIQKDNVAKFRAALKARQQASQPTTRAKKAT